MIRKSYEINKNKANLLKSNFYLLYGENLGLKKDIKDTISKTIKESDKERSVEAISLYENDINANEEIFYDFFYSGSLFSKKKIITIFEATDKIIKKIEDVYEKKAEDVCLIVFSDLLDKKSKLRNFFEKNEKTTCVACYPDNERDLQNIAQLELRKNNISISHEAINLLIEKSNSDRNNLKSEIEKIKSYSLNKKELKTNEIMSLINFSGEYKSDQLINECLCGNILQYKKILSELYSGVINQVLLLRLLNNKIHRLLKIKNQAPNSTNLEELMKSAKPAIFWKEKPLVKKQLLIWKLRDLKIIIDEINNTEILCKKNPQISKVIFFNFFSNICKKASNFS
jgi:DNA polymerase III subunit delta